jgi:biopolymer transport protein ExbD
MKRLATRFRSIAVVPTTSMADIAFLLIIFFMVTAEFSVRKGLEFALPAEDAAGAAADAPTVFIDVDAGGRLLLDGAPGNVEDIRRTLTPRLAASPNQWVVIRTDGEAQYSSVIDVLDELKRLGVRNIALPTQDEMAAWGDT